VPRRRLPRPLHFRDYITIEWEVHGSVVGQGFPFPEDGSRIVSQDDLPRIIESIRQENAAVLGPGANAP